MMDYFYYCPRCKYEKMITEIPAKSVANPRDGYGRMIFHSTCPQCGNLDAGCMWINKNTDFGLDKMYCKSAISLYQNVRTIDPPYKEE